MSSGLYVVFLNLWSLSDGHEIPTSLVRYVWLMLLLLVFNNTGLEMVSLKYELAIKPQG